MATGWLLISVAMQIQAEDHVRTAFEFYQKAVEASKTGDLKTAEAAFLRAIAIEPTYMEAYRQLAGIYVDTKRPEQAGFILTRLLQMEPDWIPERLQLAQLLAEAGEWPRALGQYNIALRLAPDNSAAACGFAEAAWKNGMKDRALAVAMRTAGRDARCRALIQRIEGQGQKAR
jgi:tetratricopeptide (TPR) repeat protein